MNVGTYVMADSKRHDSYAGRYIDKGTRGVIAILLEDDRAYVDWKIDGQIIRGRWLTRLLEPIPALILLAEAAE